jgi:PAS domain S-box-containing protein
MTDDGLGRQIETARERLARLVQRSDELPPAQRDLILEALEAFSTTIEELQVAGEELREQNEELISTQEELAAEHRRYRDLFELAPDGYLVTNPEGVIRAANCAAAEMLGKPQEWLAGTPVSVYVVGQDQLIFYEGLDRVRTGALKAGAPSAKWEIHLQPKQGQPFPATMSVAPMRNASGSLTGLRWLIQDNTASKRAKERERLLEQSERDRQAIEDLVRIQEQEREILQTIMENTHAHLAYLDTHFDFVRVNSAYARGAGYSAEELIGRNHFELFPDTHNQSTFEQVRDTGQPVAFQATPFIYPDRPELGTTFWDWTLVPVKNNQGDVEGLVLSLLDVTDRVRAEAALYRRSQEFQALAEHAPDIIARFDRSLRFTYANPAIERATGIPCESFIGKTNQELGLSEALGTLWDEKLEHVFETGRGITLETNIPAPEGSHYYENRFTPEFAPNHLVESVLVVARDITEHKKAVVELEAERARLRTIIENAPEAIVVADRECRIVLANRAADKIYPQPDLDHQQYETHANLQLCDSRGRPFAPRDLPLTRSALDGKTYDNLEMVAYRPEGESRDLLVSTAPIRDMHGQLSGSVGVFQDITERKQVEKALQKRNRELRLLNKLAWELSATLELGQVFERVGEATREVTGAEGSSIWLWDEERPGWLVRRAAFLPGDSEPLPPLRLRSGEGIVGWVAQHGESTVVHDTSKDNRFSPRFTGFQIHSMLVVPMRRRGAVVGVLEALNEPGQGFEAFDANDRLLLETLANPAATAIENARLYDQARQSAAEAERRRLARELHDAVSQTLFSASVIAEALPRLWQRDPEKVRGGLAQLHSLTRGALAEMRALLLELRPTALMEANLEDLLQQLTDAFASRSRVHILLDMAGHYQFPSEVRIALYRISQEALNNVIKHARAKEVVVSLQGQPEGLRLCIRDDGRGFDPAAVSPEHMGLKILRERAAAIGAQLEISTEVGRGTEIVVLWQGNNAEERWQ